MLIIDQHIVLLYLKATVKVHIFCDRENWETEVRSTVDAKIYGTTGYGKKGCQISSSIETSNIMYFSYERKYLGRTIDFSDMHVAT
jgi:hypothetical protein